MKIIKTFIDTEFTGLHKNTTLISIGLVSECGKTFYAEFNDYDKSQIDDWLRNNVLSHLKFSEPPADQQEHYSATRSVDNPQPNNIYSGYSLEMRGDTEMVRNALSQWIAQFDQIEVWSDCLAYDWVLFCQIWGGAFSIPKNVYYIPFDICTLLKLKGIDPDIHREDFADMIGVALDKHNALWDARVIYKCYQKLMSME